MTRCNHNRAPLLLFGVALLLGLGSIVGARSDANFEVPPTLHARDLAPPSLLSGKGFHVDDQVPTDGMTANFIIRTDLGILEADGLEILKIRVAEVQAMTELQQTSKAKVFARSVATNAVRPVTAAGQMILNPVETVKGLPVGCRGSLAA